MVAIHVPQYEPEEWCEPADDDPRRRGLDVGRWPEPPKPIVRPRYLPDRATRIRRRRLALVLLVAVTVLSCVGLWRMTEGASVGTDRSLQPITAAVYVVQPGDTFWSIAQRLAPEQDPRGVVDELRRRHGDGELEVGDRLDLADLA